MKCPNCGRENENGAKFCSKCGRSLETSKSYKKVPETEKAKKKGKRPILIGIVGVLLIGAVIIAGIWITKENRVKKQYQDHLASGQKYLEELNYESAEDSYLKAIDIDPKDPEPYLKLIDTYIAQEKYDDAAKVAKKAQTQVPEKNKGEFEKLEQEYDSVVDYEWAVEPTIEADDIYYVRQWDEYTYSTNELNQQEEKYAILKKEGNCGLIDIQGKMCSEMIYQEIYNSPYGLLLKRTEPRFIPDFNSESDLDILYADGTIDFVDGLGGGGRTKGMFYWYNDTLHNTNEYYDKQNPEFAEPVQIPDETIPVLKFNSEYQWQDFSDIESWWESADEKYAVYKGDRLMTDFVYDELGACVNGSMAAEKDGKWGYINDKGETVIPFEYEPSWGKGFFYDRYGTADLEVPDEKAFCYAASGGFVPLLKDGQWKLVNMQGETAIPYGVFETIRPVYDGKCWVKKDGKWGVIRVAEETGEEFKNSIVGVWTNALQSTGDVATDSSQEYTSRYSTQFKSDGTVETTGYRNIDTGTYEVVGENTIQATFDQNYFESAGQNKQLIEGYTYTVLYTYDENKDTLYSEYDQTFIEVGYSNASSGELVR